MNPDISLSRVILKYATFSPRFVFRRTEGAGKKIVLIDLFHDFELY